LAIDLKNNEQILRASGANLANKLELVGGKLYLTNQNLIFQSHIFNFSRPSLKLPLSEIDFVHRRWTRLLKVIPLFPNSIAVGTRNGTIFSFTVFNREAWIQAISEAKARV
jgi:hypothetical protein